MPKCLPPHPLHTQMPQKMQDFLNGNTPTPFVVMDLDIIRKTYIRTQELYKTADIFYAVKANADIPVLEILRDLGASFDVASLGEIKRVLSLGTCPTKLSYGNTVKKASEIKQAYNLGIRMFAFDCMDELQKIAKNAPEAQVFCRILVNCDGAEWPLSRKFGCDPAYGVKLLKTAQHLGLNPVGISIHVGSQQMTLQAWDDALKHVTSVWGDATAHGIPLDFINLGGGMCSQYDKDIIDAPTYANGIMASLHTHFGDAIPKLILEPGRSMVGDAGVMKTEIITIADKTGQDTVPWVYIDAGILNGLFEALGEAIRYQIISDAQRHGKVLDTIAYTLAGPSCDTADIMYNTIHLPKNIVSGDALYILSTGAYTSSYACAWFNGFSPIQTYFVDSASDS